MATQAADCGLITTVSELDQVFARVMIDARAGRPFAWDIETGYEGEPRPSAAVHPEENFICGFSLTSSTSWARAVPTRFDSGENLPESTCAKLLWKALQTAMGVVHNLDFEQRTTARWFRRLLWDDPEVGPEVRAQNGYARYRSCTMLESYAEGRNRRHGLKDLTLDCYQHQMIKLADLFPKAPTQAQEKSVRFNSLNQHDPQVIQYMCEDSIWALQHHLDRHPRLLASPQRAIYLLEMEVLPVVIAMEDEGVVYDWLMMREGAIRAKEFKDKLATEISMQLTALLRQADPDAQPVQINLASSQQVAKVLYDDLKMPVRRRTSKGRKPSTDKLALKGLASQFPVVRRIQEWKQLTKLHGTYLEKYPALFNYASDGRAHPGHLQHGVPAGRFSVDNPPYQQSPKVYHYELLSGETFDYSFRDGIMAPKGWYILGFDLSQMELRVIAGESQEKALLDAFERDEDVHSLTASLMLGKPLAEVTKADRALGKTLNFALVYQMGVDGLAERLGITADAAEELFNQYFAAYPAIRTYINQIVATAAAQGYLVTKFGRRVPIWELQSDDPRLRRQGERTAGNVPVQGPGTGDYPKFAMVRAHKALKAAGLDDRVKLVMNIHDALEFYVRDDVPLADVIQVLEPAVIFRVPGWPKIKADWHAGRRWGSVRELEWDGHDVRLKEQENEIVIEAAPDEEGPALPELDLSAIQGQSATAVPGEELHPVAPDRRVADLRAHRKVIIQVSQMLTEFQFAALQQLLAVRPGDSPLLLRTPQGDVELGVTSLDPGAEQAVCLALGCPALVTYELDGNDLARLASGLL